MTEDEKDLLIGCFSGDRRVQGDFVTRFSDLVYHTVLNTFKTKAARWHPQDVEDLHQTVFMRLLEKGCRRLRQYRGKNGCSLRSWVRMIAVRTVIDHLRSRKDALAHAGTLDPAVFLDHLQADHLDPVHLLDRARQMDSINRGLQLLAPRDRLFIKLHCLKEMSIGEVAGILGVTENNAYSIKHRALQRLKSAIQAAAQGMA
jgi:RNA polymerase sigma-70 factor (ECF subfamily)